VQDLSVLTPPLLMCAAVLFAIGAFLRHEMSKKRPEVDESDSAQAAARDSAESAAPPPEAIAGPSTEEETGNDTTGADASESTPRKL
jgi:hypothetical protein